MATYTVAPGGGNINSASTYVGGVGIPGSTDEINFTTSSGQLTVNTTTTIQDIDFSNYQNVITFNSTLSVSRNITFGDAGGLSTYTVASGANGDFRKTGTGNLTSNGKIWTFRFTFAPGSYTITLIDKITISGLITVSGATGNTFTLNSSDDLDPERFDVLGDFTSSGTGAVLTGNATIKFTGTSNQTISYSSTGQTRSNIKIDKTGGTLSLSGTINYNTGTFTYVQGTVDAGTSTLNSIISTTFATDGITWNNFTFAGTTAQTFTLNNNLTVSGTLSFSGTTTTTINGSDIIVTGNLSVTTTATITGSFDILINGTGSQTWSHTAVGYLGTSVTIDKTSGVLTLGTNIYYQSGTLAFVSSGGTVNTTNNSNTLNIGSTCILNTNGINWNNVRLNTGTIDLTLNSDFNIEGTFRATGIGGALTLTFGGSGIFNPTGDFVANDSSVGSGGALTITITLPNNISVSSFTYDDNSGAAHRRSVTLNGNRTITISGGIYLGATRGSTISGNCTLIANGTGNITCGIVAGTPYSAVLSIPLNIVGTYTLVNFPNFTSTTITLTAPTITGASCIFTTCTLNFSNNIWAADSTIRGTTPLTSNATFINLTTDTTNVSFTGASTISVLGNLSVNISTSGTTTPILINGTGSQTWSASSYLNNNLTIEKLSGTLSLGPNVYYQSGTFSYVTGSVVTTNNTFNIGTTCNLNTNGITWYNVANAVTSTVNLISDLLWINNWNVTGGTLTFTGSGSLTASSTGNVAFSGTSVITLKNQIQVVNATLGITTINTSTMSIVGNLTISNTTSGTTGLLINGTSSQTWTSTAYLANNLTINKPSGTLTLGSFVYYQSGILTHISGDVDVLANSNTLNIGLACSLNTSNINWNIITTTLNVTSFNTLLSDLYCKTITILYYGLGATQFGLSGNFKLICDTLNVSSNITANGTFIVPSNNIYTNNLTLNGRASGGGKINCTGGKFYVNGNLTVATTGGINTNQYGYYGSEIIMTGSGNLYTNFGISNPLTFDTSGTIRVTSTYFYYGSREVGTSNPLRLNLKYLRGNIKAENSILYLEAAGIDGSSNPYFYELTNINKIVFKEVFIASSRSGVSNNIYMNEFFSGSSTVKTRIQGITPGINYVVNFTDNFEKITKFVDINNCTLLRPGQLLITTSQNRILSPTSSNIGIRYRNNLPNGIPKNLPTAFQPSGALSVGYLMSDPAIQKSI